MRILNISLALTFVTALAGCGSVVIQTNPETDGGAADVSPTTDTTPVLDRPVVDRPVVTDVPRACTRPADCEPGSECLGGEGCAIPWTCQPSLGRPCTDDLAPFCGCDRVTFFSSSSCPTQPYASRGACERPPAPADAGPAGCILPDGSLCAVGNDCPIGECSVCSCAAPGVLRCTGVCFDAGPPLVPCRGNVDCSAGTQCVGPEGCGIPWSCQPATPCTRDLVTYCACDGTTFMASSSCPGRPFAQRGACRMAPTPPCPPQDARGMGTCTAFFGYAWDGSQCVGVGGCSCVGTDCRSLAGSLAQCNLEHRTCPRAL